MMMISRSSLVKESLLLNNIVVLDENKEEKKLYEVSNFVAMFNRPIFILYLDSINLKNEYDIDSRFDLLIVGEEQTGQFSYYKDVSFKNTFKIEHKAVLLTFISDSDWKLTEIPKKQKTEENTLNL